MTELGGKPIVDGLDGVPRVVHEPRSRRRLIRVRMPLEVIVDGRRYQACDCSLGGFSLGAADAGWAPGDHVRASLVFPVEHLAVQFTVECQVARAGTEQTGFRFCDLKPDQLDFLRQVMDAFVTGRVVAVDAALSVLRGSESGLQLQSAMGEQRSSLGAIALRLTGYGMLLAAGVALLVVAGFSVYGRLLTVRSEYAAVTGPVVTIAAPSDGVLVGALPRLGMEVAENAALLDLKNERLDTDIRTAEAALHRQAAILASLHRRHRAAVAFLSVYEDLAEAAVAEADADLAGMMAEFDAATRHAERVRSLHANGFAAEVALETALRRKEEAESAVEGAAAGLSAARINKDIAGAGRLFTGSRIEGREPEEIAEDIAVAEAEHSFLERRLAALRAQRSALAMASPCTCIVHAVLRQPGEWVAAGTAVLQLVPVRGDGLVMAKVPIGRAGYLQTGGAAQVLLADRATPVTGTILDVRLAPPAVARAGLPAAIDQDPRFASVAVGLDAMVPVVTGTPAEILFPMAIPAATFRWWGTAGPTAVRQ